MCLERSIPLSERFIEVGAVLQQPAAPFSVHDASGRGFTWQLSIS